MDEDTDIDPVNNENGVKLAHKDDILDTTHVDGNGDNSVTIVDNSDNKHNLNEMLLTDDSEEQYNCPWMMDSSGEKRFALAGFNQNDRVGQEQVDNVTIKIRELGGCIVEGDFWNPETTHVVLYNDPHKEGLTEKVTDIF